KMGLTAPIDWPKDVDSALCLTFDMDAETRWTSRDGASANRASVLSQGRYDVGEGLANILGLLDANNIRGTFYVPSKTAETFTDEILEISRRGHEIGSHGTDHVPLDGVTKQEEFEHLKRATESIEDLLGLSPRGYRAPMYGVTPSVWQNLRDLGYTHSSNFMDSVRPSSRRPASSNCLLPGILTMDLTFLFRITPPNFRVPVEPN